MTGTNKQILDPIGVVCRIITLNFRPKYTKIGIINNAVVIQPPSSKQWIQRYLNGDDRDNISNLFLAIIRLIEFYIYPLYEYRSFRKPKDAAKHELKNEHKNDKKENHVLKIKEDEYDMYWNCIKTLAEYMCLGLSSLQETYECGNVVYAIQYYINLVKDAIDGRYKKTRLPKSFNHDCVVDEMYEKVINFWDNKRVGEICELYNKCFESVTENKHDKIEGYLMAIEHLLNISDDNFRKTILDNGQKVDVL